VSSYTTEDTELTQRLDAWLKERRDVLKYGYPGERVADRREAYTLALTALEAVLSHAQGQLYTGPHPDPLDAGPATAALDAMAAETRELIAAALGCLEAAR